MRTYPTNSPEAAARIIALAMLADGHLCKSELDLLERAGAHSQLGLSPNGLHAVLHTLCEDLLATSHGDWENACRVSAETLSAVTAEITDADLRAKVLRLCAAVIASDEHVTESESRILDAVVAQWRETGNLPRPGDSRSTSHHA